MKPDLCGAAATFLLLSQLSVPVAAQVIQRDEVAPTCWWTGQYAWNQVQSFINTNVDRVFDISTLDPTTGMVAIALACSGMSNPVIARPHAIDVAVSRASAITLADTNGMFISAVAPLTLGGVTVFASLREQLPTGCTWTWIPATTPAGVTTWLQANPTFKPYSVDTSVGATGVAYHVMAMAGPGVRNASIVFQRPLAALPAPSQPGGDAVIAFAMDSATTFAAVVQHPEPGVRTDYITVIPMLSQYQSGSLHGTMERIFCFAHWPGPNGPIEYALAVNNAWSLYDIIEYPPSVPSPGFRGCANSVGQTSLFVNSSVSGRAVPGANLTLTLAPKEPGALGFFIFGLDRNYATSLSVWGAPNCHLIPEPDFVVGGADLGGYARYVFPVTGYIATRGQRFYAQGALLDGSGLSTSNAYMITVE